MRAHTASTAAETGCDGWLGDGRGRFLLPVIERVDAGEPVRRWLSLVRVLDARLRALDRRTSSSGMPKKGRLLRTRAGHPYYRSDAEP